MKTEGVGTRKTGTGHYIPPKGGNDVRHANALEGQALFRKFLVVELKGQHRAQDPSHLAAIASFRTWTPEALVVRDTFLGGLRHLSVEDVAADAGWADAVIVATDRKTVHFVNEARAYEFAAQHGQPVVTWRLPLQNAYTGRLSAEILDTLYTLVKDMKGTFVRGAPATLTFNLRPERGLSNGTRCRLHGLVLSEEEPEETRLAIKLAKGGEKVELRYAPHAVVVGIPWVEVKLPEVEARAGLYGDMEACTEALIPLMPVGRKVLVSRYVRTKTVPTVGVLAHPYDILFATTYHGVQCRTLPKVILCVDHPVSPALTYNAFYVGVSRVPRSSDIRLIEFKQRSDPAAALRRLRSLVPKVLLVQYIMRFPTYKVTLEHLEATYLTAGVSYSKRSVDRVVLEPREELGKMAGTKLGCIGSVGTWTCRKGCGVDFDTKSKRMSHETTCRGGITPVVPEATHRCGFGCGRSWLRVQDCKNHQRHCQYRTSGPTLMTVCTFFSLCLFRVSHSTKGNFPQKIGQED